MKTFQLLLAHPILAGLAKQPRSLAVSLRLVKHFRAASDLHRSIVEQRAELYRMYGERDDETGNTTILPEHKDKFAAEYTILMEKELVWDLPLVDPDDFGEDVDLSIVDAAKIDWFLKAA